MRHVIIGVGAAGIQAAKTIRSLSKTDEIVMISTDSSVQSRCMLHKFIEGARDKDMISFVPPAFFSDNRIRWISGKSVEGVDVQKKVVTLSNEVISYHKLLIATGANSVIPPIGGLREAKNAFGLRHLSDAEAIRSRAAGAKRIVVIGAGLVGLDAAYSLMRTDRSVTVIEMGDRIFPLNLDRHAALAYQALFEENGCTFKLSAKVTATQMEGNEIAALVLDNGEQLPCDLVVVATGVRPAIEFLAGSGIETDRVLIVDEHLRTSAPDVYAAGDVTGLSGIWPNAAIQGDVAGKNMCGGSEIYEDRYAVKNTLNFFGLVALSIGVTEPTDHDTVLIREDRQRYNKMILRDNCVVGVILQGDISGSGFWQHLIKHKINIANQADPWKLSYAEFFALLDNGEYAYSV